MKFELEFIKKKNYLHLFFFDVNSQVMKSFKYNERFFINREVFFKNVPDRVFNNPLWQIKNKIDTKEKLLSFIPSLKGQLSDNLFNKFSITPYFFCLINFDDLNNDPIAKQVIPDERENEKSAFLNIDPFNEQEKKPETQLIKRYPDRVLLVTSNICPSYCRYCTRKWNWGKGEYLNEEKLSQVLNYLTNNKNIREVIISGGEPLLLPYSFLEKIIKSIIRIEHIEVIRIASRILSFLPQKINNEFLKILKKYKPIWLVTHFNHPNEITPETNRAVEKILETGVAIVNQSVLLKGINDNAETMKRLVNDLEILRIKPYYLFNCDLIEGTKHLRADFNKGIEIMDKLRGNTGGICIPSFIIDLPEGGKVPILPEYIVERNENVLKLRNYQGRIFDYPLNSF